MVTTSVSNSIIINNLTTPFSLKPTTFINISLLNSNNYYSLFSNIAQITNLYPSSLIGSKVSANIGFLGELTTLTL
jgi:hypothetical protein